MLRSNFNPDIIEAGCDEAGRGCLAGPVVAAAVILPKDYSNNLLNDSKKISKAKRNKLRPIIEQDALDYGIGIVYEEEIDKINILNASFKAMHLAIEQLKIQPEHLLIDGNRFHSYPDIPHSCIIKGDGIFMSIAAASILAKCFRDEYMEKLHLEEPNYEWHKNKGYPTQRHKKALELFGASKYHRQSFTLFDPPELF